MTLRPRRGHGRQTDTIASAKRPDGCWVRFYEVREFDLEAPPHRHRVTRFLGYGVLVETPEGFVEAEHEGTARAALAAVYADAVGREPDCAGDPRCTVHRGGSHGMTSAKPCRR